MGSLLDDPLAGVNREGRQAGDGEAELVVWMIMASIGNLVGGVGFVTLFRIAQVKEKKRQR